MSQRFSSHLQNFNALPKLTPQQQNEYTNWLVTTSRRDSDANLSLWLYGEGDPRNQGRSTEKR